jgi:hypothetical protein
MKHRSLAIACCLLFTASIFAQSGGAAADPISGTWTGSLAPQSSTRRNPIIMELKFDGKAVSGTGGPNQAEINYAEIKNGTFDPKTGALKFEGVPRNGAPLTFEGTVVEGVAIGRVSGDNTTGTFKITKKVDGDSAAAPGGNDKAALRKNFDEVSGWITKAADLVPADKYTYRPAASVRTFGQLIAHVADSYNYFCARAAGRNIQWSDAIEKGNTDKATLVQKLKQSLETCNSAYGGAGLPDPLIDNIGHTNLHYGNIITYMRMLGMTPPSS